MISDLLILNWLMVPKLKIINVIINKQQIIIKLWT
jgi:hypothetical protein